MATYPLTPEQQALLDHGTYADLHPTVMKLVESGDFTILDLFDTLQWFRGAADWTAWRAFLCALYALPMTDEEFRIYRECTGRRHPPEAPAREAWCPTGRRARKSAIAALIAVFEGGFRDYSKYLAPGERAVIPILGKSKEEAKQIHAYSKAILSDPSLVHLLEEEPQAETIKLRGWKKADGDEVVGGVDLRIRAVSLTAGRSKSIPLAELDEVAFFATEGAVPDLEVVRAIRPGMSTIPGSKLFALSSPFGKRGLLYENTKAYYPITETKDGERRYEPEKEAAANKARVLVWKAPTLRMHDTPQLQAEVDREYQADPVSAAAEYGAEFRDDTAAFVLERVLDTAIVVGRKFLPPARRNYFAFIDPSGGSADSLTLAIAHFEQEELVGPGIPLAGGPVLEHIDTPTAEAPEPYGKIVLDFLEEWRAPFDTETVASQCSQRLKRYGLRKALADAYGGKWPKTEFRRHGISVGTSPMDKSELYRTFLPMLNNTGQVELLDHPMLKPQFLNLQRNLSRRGRETIDHETGKHDDVANAVAGACVYAKLSGPRLKEPEQLARAEPPKPTTTTEIMQQRVAEMLARERGARPAAGGGGRRYGGARNIHRRRR